MKKKTVLINYFSVHTYPWLLNVTGSVSNIFFMSSGIVSNNILLSTVSGITVKGKLIFFASHSFKGFLPSIDAIVKSWSPKHIPSNGKRSSALFI